MQEHKSKEQTEGNGDGDDHGRTEIEQEEQQNDQDEHHAAEEIVFDGCYGVFDEDVTVVERNDLDVFGQDVFIEVIRLLFHGRENGLRLFAAAHEDNALDGIIVLAETEFAETWGVSDDDFAYLADADGCAVVRTHDDVGDILSVLDQPEAADVKELSTLVVESAASIGVVHRKRVDHLRDGEVESVEFHGVEFDHVLHGRSAEAGVIGHAGNGFVGTLDHPIFDGVEFLRRA